MAKTWDAAKKCYISMLSETRHLNSQISTTRGSFSVVADQKTDIISRSDTPSRSREIVFINKCQCIISVLDLIYPSASMNFRIEVRIGAGAGAAGEWIDANNPNRPPFPLYLAAGETIFTRIRLDAGRSTENGAKPLPLGLHRGSIIALVRFCPPSIHLEAINSIYSPQLIQASPAAKHLVAFFEPLIGVGSTYECLVLENAKTDASPFELDGDSNSFVPKAVRNVFETPHTLSFDSNIPIINTMRVIAADESSDGTEGPAGDEPLLNHVIMFPPQTLQGQGQGQNAHHSLITITTGSQDIRARSLVFNSSDYWLQHWTSLIELEYNYLLQQRRQFDMFNVNLKLQKNLNLNSCTLSVPGLPESRPQLMVGEHVVIRLAKMPDVQVIGLIINVKKDNVRILLGEKNDDRMIYGNSVSASERNETAWNLLFPDSHSLLGRGRGRGHSTSTSSPTSVVVHVRFPDVPFEPLQAQHMAINFLLNAKTWRLRPILYENDKNRLDSQELHTEVSGVGEVDESDVFTVEIETLKEKQKPMKMTDEQKLAVKLIESPTLSPKLAKGHLCVVSGGAGTGKTLVVVEGVKRAVLKGGRVLLTAPSLTAVDVLCQRLSHSFGPEDMLLILPWQRMFDTLPLDILPYTTINRTYGMVVKERFDLPSPERMKRAKIVITTCNTAITLASSLYSNFNFTPGFDRIIIEEAGQATEPETLVPLVFSSSLGVGVGAGFGFGDREGPVPCYLFGDAHQLSPIVHCKQALSKGLGVSLLQRVCTQEQPDCVHITLTKNFRQHSTLLEFPSQTFYKGDKEGMVACGDQSDGNVLSSWEELKESVPLLFYSVPSRHIRVDDQSSSWFNPDEAIHLVKLVGSLLSSPRLHSLKLKHEDIGVVAPFRGQVYRLRELFRHRGMGAVRVGTIDDLQGQEHRCLFVSACIGRNLRATSSIMEALPHLFEPKRFNVMITRAISMLVVVGDHDALSVSELWTKFIDFCKEKDCFVSIGSGSDGDGDGGTNSTGESNSEELVDKMANVLLGVGTIERIYPPLDGDIRSHFLDHGVEAEGGFEFDEQPFRVNI